MIKLNHSNKKSWLNLLWLFLILIGIYSLITFYINETRYRIYLSHPDSSELILEIKQYWGIKTSVHPLKYRDGGWDYQLIKNVQKNKSGLAIVTYGEWKSVPVIHGIFDPEYIKEIDVKYDDY